MGEPLEQNQKRQERYTKGACRRQQMIDEDHQGMQGGSQQAPQPIAEKDLHGDESRGDEDEAGHDDRHLEGQQTALPPGAVLRDFPGAVQGFLEGHEHSRRAPQQQQKRDEADSPVSARDADQILHDEISFDGQVALQDRGEPAREFEAADVNSAHPEQQQEHGKNGQQGVVGDGCRNHQRIFLEKFPQGFAQYVAGPLPAPLIPSRIGRGESGWHFP